MPDVELGPEHEQEVTSWDGESEPSEIQHAAHKPLGEPEYQGAISVPGDLTPGAPKEEGE